MRTDDFIELEDILFVFEQWTLIIKSELCGNLTPGDNVELFDETMDKLADAQLGKFLSSRNPDISALEVNPQIKISEMKKVKFLKMKVSDL